ncbi:MAG: hypothetical protein SFU56_02795 [Capsulimonadales bacterium]|nr:hypothetical protein [Capsulimonadales bacterium]
MSGDPAGSEYIGRTLRSALVVVAFVLAITASYGQVWAILPYLGGFALAAVLLAGMERFIRAVIRPDWLGTEIGAEAKERRRQVGTLWFLGFALIKYPLVALLLWWLVRVWDTRQLMVFAGGFLTLHLVMGLRAMGRVLTQTERK